MTFIFGSSSVLLLVITMLVNAMANSDLQHNAKSPTFLPKQKEKNVFVKRPPFRTSNDGVVNCESDEASDSEARFALQYQNEQGALRYSESSYLIQERKLQKFPMVVPASTLRLKSSFPILEV